MVGKVVSSEEKFLSGDQSEPGIGFYFHTSICLLNKRQRRTESTEGTEKPSFSLFIFLANTAIAAASDCTPQGQRQKETKSRGTFFFFAFVRTEHFSCSSLDS